MSENTEAEAQVSGDEAVTEEQDGATEETVLTAPDQESPAGDKSEDAGQEGQPETADEDISLAVPEGAEAFTADVEAFNKHMADWRAENSEASSKAVLEEALKYQAKATLEAQDAAIKQAESLALQWVDDCKSDKEFGGDKFDENASMARKAVEAFGDDDLKSLLNQSGLGNHPAVFRAFVRASKAITEAQVAKGDAATPARSAAEILYS